MSLKKVRFFGDLNDKSYNFNPFLSNTPLVKEFILLISRSYNEKEANNVLMQKKENNRWLEECS